MSGGKDESLFDTEKHMVPSDDRQNIRVISGLDAFGCVKMRHYAKNPRDPRQMKLFGFESVHHLLKIGPNLAPILFGI